MCSELSLLLLFCFLKFTYEQAITNPVVYYTFEGGSIFDISGNNYHATTLYRAKPSPDRFGRLNSAYYFDGNAYISGSATGFPTKDRTISLWFKPDIFILPNNPNIDDRDRGGILFGYGGIATCGTSYHMIINNLDTRPNCYEVQGGCRINQVTKRDETMLNAPSKWHHWVVTIADNLIRMYIDGSFVIMSNTFEETHTNGAGFCIGMGVSFSGSPYTDQNACAFRGYLDDIAIYNYSLSESNIMEIFSYIPPTTIPIGTPAPTSTSSSLSPPTTSSSLSPPTTSSTANIPSSSPELATPTPSFLNLSNQTPICSPPAAVASNFEGYPQTLRAWFALISLVIFIPLVTLYYQRKYRYEINLKHYPFAGHVGVALKLRYTDFVHGEGKTYVSCMTEITKILESKASIKVEENGNHFQECVRLCSEIIAAKGLVVPKCLGNTIDLKELEKRNYQGIADQIANQIGKLNEGEISEDENHRCCCLSRPHRVQNG